MNIKPSCFLIVPEDHKVILFNYSTSIDLKSLKIENINQESIKRNWPLLSADFGKAPLYSSP
jgi:hypothetical protein